jgi:hypothetical protein
VKGNLVSGNWIAGIRSGGASGAAPNLIENNTVGSDATGTQPIPNGEGIGLYGDQAGTQVYSNLIAFNTTAAVRLVEGTVGAKIGGLGPGEGNTIRNNGAAVLVGYNAGATGDVNNTILSNVITGSGLAIDLGSDGQTANDGGPGNYDTDDGPNHLQNAPIINLAANLLGRSTTLVDYTPHAAAGSYTLQFFSGANCTGAEALIKTSSVFVSGNFERRVEDLGVLLPVGTRVFMTATDSAGNTSEFKSCVDVTAPAVSYSAATGHYYQYVNVGTPDWNTANSAANAATFAGLSGHLVSITSAAEQTVVHNLKTQMGLGDMRAWIGLYDPSGSGNFGWTTGEGLIYSNWNPGEPNNIGGERWVEFFGDGTWNNNAQVYFGNQGYVIEYQ